jgi:sporulation protein YlmC with PRC-barrel domain
MSSRDRIVSVALAASITALSATAYAQDAPRTDASDEYARALPYEAYLKGQDLRTSKLVGKPVKNAMGEDLGEIEELLIVSNDPRDNMVIVSVGGFLGIGDKLVALPYRELRVSADGDEFYIDRSQDQLGAAPAFSYERQIEAQRQAAAPGASAGSAPDRAGADANRSSSSARGQARSPTALAEDDYRASDIIGAEIVDSSGQEVGKIDDLVVSTGNDALHAVVSIDGGGGRASDKLIAIPVDDLKISAAETETGSSRSKEPHIRVGMTAQQLLESKPEFSYERRDERAAATRDR